MPALMGIAQHIESGLTEFALAGRDWQQSRHGFRDILLHPEPDAPWSQSLQLHCQQARGDHA
jgi:hypothetical protein